MSDDKALDPAAAISERWIEQAQRRTSPPKPLTAEEREELAILRKEARQIREDTAILRRAIAFYLDPTAGPATEA